MVSKKLITPALAGTGAVGASGTLAWALGLFDGEGLDDVVDEKGDDADPGLQENSPSDQAYSAKQPESSPDKYIQRGRAVTSAWRRLFEPEGEASEHDKKVINLNLKVELKKIMQALIVSAEGDSWSCQLNPISIEDEINSNHESEEFERQKKQLEKALENNDYKGQFVANCFKTRLTNEKQGGNSSTIELETERITWEKYKFKEKGGYFEKLWTEDFTGVDRIKKEDEWLLENESNFVSKIEGKNESETTGKVEMSLVEGSKKWVCNISGTSTKNLGAKTFKGDNLKEILEKKEWNGISAEKKRYLIRNCAKNNGEIKGLTIQTAGKNEWKFGDLKKITEGMYENSGTPA